jgi:hypothetical protein
MLNYIILACAIVVLVGYRKLTPTPLAIVGAASAAVAILISILTWDRGGDETQFYARVATGVIALVLVGLFIRRRRESVNA